MPFFRGMFDCLPVRISTSDLHHWILLKESIRSELMILECSFPYKQLSKSWLSDDGIYCTSVINETIQTKKEKGKKKWKQWRKVCLELNQKHTKKHMDLGFLSRIMEKELDEDLLKERWQFRKQLQCLLGSKLLSSWQTRSNDLLTDEQKRSLRKGHSSSLSSSTPPWSFRPDILTTPHFSYMEQVFCIVHCNFVYFFSSWRPPWPAFSFCSGIQ